MIKFSRAALNGPRHDTPFCNSLCNVCEAQGTWVNPVFRQGDQVLGQIPEASNVLSAARYGARSQPRLATQASS
jgi:hypothetical protein